MISISLKKKIFIVSLFAIAMGFLEAIVVVYIRELYYPGGFVFPLKLIPTNIFTLELVRELTTLIMLGCIGILIGRTPIEKFSWFLFTFGVWDIFYYVALKILINWPASILTWDILFLIPVTWIGPVLAPVICSITIIFLSLAVVLLSEKNYIVKIYRVSWILIICGAVIIFISFIHDYTGLLIREGYFSKGGPSLLDPGLADAITSFIPHRFHWGIFVIGEVLILAGIVWTIYKTKFRE